MLTWRANYHDNNGRPTEEGLSQFNNDGSENKYDEIDRLRLGRFDLINEQGKPVYSVYLHTGQRLVYRRRHFVPLNGGKRSLVHVVGWVETVYTGKGTREIYAFNYIFEDGTMALDDHRGNIALLACER